MIQEMLFSGVTLKGGCILLAGPPLTVGDTTPIRLQAITFSVNEKLKDSKRRDSTTSNKISTLAAATIVRTAVYRWRHTPVGNMMIPY